MTSDGGPARLPAGAPRPRADMSLVARVEAGLRNVRHHLRLTPVWGGLMALCALAYLLLHGRAATGQTAMILAVFFAGGTLAFPIAVFLSRGLAFNRGAETRFASIFLCLTLATIGTTAVLFMLQYRLFFSRWHAPFGTRIWFYQFAFTGAGALYQFIVMGVRLYMPMGLPALIGMSLWLAKHPDGPARPDERTRVRR